MVRDQVVCERWCVTKCHTASPVPQVPRLPRETKVDVSKCHTSHAKWRKTKVDVTKCHAYHAKSRCAKTKRKMVCEKDGV